MLEAGIRFTAARLGKEGIRCNGISAGSKPAALASPISANLWATCSFPQPTGRNVTSKKWQYRRFLLSDLASVLLARLLHADGGYSINALNDEEN